LPFPSETGPSEIPPPSFESVGGFEEGEYFVPPLPKSYAALGKDSWNLRTKQVLGVLQEQFSEGNKDEASFDNLTTGISRRTAALCFFEILQLKTWNYIDVEQEVPFDDIRLTPGVSHSFSL
jgi:hypothetical protein